MTVTELGPDDGTDLIVPGWSVIDALALIEDVELPISWSEWEASYFDTPEPTATDTVLVVRVLVESAVLRGHETEVHDAICEDWIEVIVDVEISTQDGTLSGTTDAEFILRPTSEKTTLYFSTSAAELGLVTTWPAHEDRPVPDEMIVRLDLVAPQMGLDAQSTGELWLHRVWVFEEDGHSQRVEELTKLAVIG
ncbi:MAG: hypothetical protein R6X02_06800 [Enhygromyxa sp.]